MTDYPWSHLSITFHPTAGEPLPFEERRGLLPPPIGTGIVGERGERYRVDDVWLSLEKDGRFDVGYHVFVRLVDGGADDLLGRLEPEYYFGD